MKTRLSVATQLLLFIATASAQSTVIYTCPMHPESVARNAEARRAWVMTQLMRSISEVGNKER